MDNPSSYGYQENVPAMEQPDQQQPLTPGGYPSQYKFTPDEMRVLGECNRESFIQRSMPFATFLGLGAYVGVQKGFVHECGIHEMRVNLWICMDSGRIYYKKCLFCGATQLGTNPQHRPPPPAPLHPHVLSCHLKPNARFGAIPKVTLAVMAGYFIGKLSYQQACAEKLMALPGSYIGQLLRERRDGKVGGSSMKQRQGPNMFGAKATDIYSDAGPGSALDLDTDRPSFTEESYRPTDTDGPHTAAAPDGLPARPSVSYDDLRRKNRGEHSDAKKDPYRTESLPVVTRPRYSSPPAAPHTNQYGDIMD